MNKSKGSFFESVLMNGSYNESVKWIILWITFNEWLLWACSFNESFKRLIFEKVLMNDFYQPFI